MNPIIQYDLMQARIADMHRQARRSNAGSRKHTAISRICWCAIALVAGAMVFLAGAPAALAINVPPPGGSAGTQVAPPPVVNLATAGGTPGWQIVLIAVGSALVACVFTLLAVRATRRATPAQPSQS
jgi:hypothetical protein